MCIIVYKPKNKIMPNEDTLRQCFVKNPDGAGYMFNENGKVIIKKGYMNFKAFYNAVMLDYERLGKETSFVLHFRIETQGGVNQECTHPFPLSKNMCDLRQLDFECDFGVAHNGIISLTSTSSYTKYYNTQTKTYQYDYNKPDYSDTMKFITEYLSLIIKNKNWYKDEDKLDLIEKLVGWSNKFAIMNNDGQTTLVGNFIEDNGCYYSNSSYEILMPTTFTQEPKNDFSFDEDDLDYDFDKYYNEETQEYDFPKDNCPCTFYEDYSMCEFCSHYKECMSYYIDKEIDDDKETD
jgi:predicted glutamine amidotransferase